MHAIYKIFEILKFETKHGLSWLQVLVNLLGAAAAGHCWPLVLFMVSGFLSSSSISFLFLQSCA